MQRLIYIHETTTLGNGGFQKFCTGFAELYHPVMEKHGARLFGHWRGNPFSSHWTEITTIWEIDSMAHFGKLSEARTLRGEAAEAFVAWDRLMDGIGATGEGRLCHGNDDIQSIERLKAESFDSSGVLQEIMVTKPGKQREYLQQLKRLFVPWSEASGNRWLGSFVPVMRNEEVIHYWAIKGGLSGFGQGNRTEETEEMLRTWMAVAPALRESWDDSLLAALPGHPLVG